MTATDTEVGVCLEVGGIEVEQAGVFLAPVLQLGSILRESMDARLRIEADSHVTLVRGERSEFRLPAQTSEEFPTLPKFADDSYYVVSARLFKELIRRTIFATDTESSRYALGGVLLEFEEDRIIGVATDGRRLASMEGPVRHVGDKPKPDTMTIVPTRAMQLMERAIVDMESEVEIAIHVNDVLVRCPQTTIYARLVEGRFPKWREVFPVRQNAVRIELTVGPLYSAVRQASIVASGESRGIDFTFNEGSLVLSLSTADVGQSRVEFPIPFNGPPIKIALDHRYVADLLRVLEPEKSIAVEIQDAESAAVFATDDGYKYVVMPMARDA
jgi:DNA polymerase-3 subunit beta